MRRCLDRRHRGRPDFVRARIAADRDQTPVSPGLCAQSRGAAAARLAAHRPAQTRLRDHAARRLRARTGGDGGDGQAARVRSRSRRGRAVSRARHPAVARTVGAAVGAPPAAGGRRRERLDLGIHRVTPDRAAAGDAGRGHCAADDRRMGRQRGAVGAAGRSRATHRGRPQRRALRPQAAAVPLQPLATAPRRLAIARADQCCAQGICDDRARPAHGGTVTRSPGYRVHRQDRGLLQLVGTSCFAFPSRDPTVAGRAFPGRRAALVQSEVRDL